MRINGKKRTVFVAVMATSVAFASPQNQTQPSPAVQAPFTSQVKKTVVFLTTSCLHNFATDATQLTLERVKQLPLSQQGQIAQQVQTLVNHLENVKASMAKLSKEDREYALQNVSPTSIASSDLPDYIAWRINALVKMTDLSQQELSSLTDQELALIPSDDHQGTGFFAAYSDSRIPPTDPAKTEQRSFVYLITNHHVIEPGIELGLPCKRLGTTILLNRKPDAQHTSDYTETTRIDKILKWVFPEDESVDLATASIGAPQDLYDYFTIDTKMFVSEQEVKDKKVVEGDPVLFAGLFIQSFKEAHTLEPIVRSGSLAMLPEGLLPTTMNNKNGHIYLTEAHAFGGNSGSPMFVDDRKFTQQLGYEYKLLGVISGEIFENADLTMSVTTTLAGNVAANSDVSIVVPASEVLKLLNGRELTLQRDNAVKTMAIPPAADFKKK